MTDRVPHKQRPHPLRFAAALVAAAVWVQAAPASAPRLSAPPALQPEDDLEAVLALLTDPSRERPGREAAADRLLMLAARGPAAMGLVGLLEDDGDANGARGLVLAAVSRSPDPPPGLFRTIRDQIERSPQDRLPPLLAAAGSFRTRESARLLVRFTEPDRPGSVRAAAFRSLARLSGRDDLGQDRAAWQGWVADAAELSESQWRARLVAGLAGRADRVDAERIANLEQLVEVHRRLYFLIPPDERPRQLVHLLEAREDLRNLGFELTARELAAGKELDGSIADAALRLLTHARPQTRARAAQLVSQLAPPTAGAALGGVLAVETDPETAAALLQATVRWPSPLVRDAALAWLESGLVPRPAATQALLAVHRAGLLDDGDHRGRTLGHLRAADPTTLSLASMRLLVSLGDHNDQERVASLLDSTAQPTRMAAADALLDSPDHLDRVIDAAGTDQSLFDFAVRGVIARRATAEGYRSLAGVPNILPDVRRAGLLQLARALPTSELVSVCRETEDLALCEALLARIAEPGQGANPDDPTGEHRAAALLLLTRVRLDLSRPDRALAALDAIGREASDRSGVRHLRTVALLWTNRIDQAAEVDGPADSWLEGLERAIGERHAAAIAAAIRERFGTSLSEAQAHRLGALQARIASEKAAEATPPGATGPS